MGKIFVGFVSLRVSPMMLISLAMQMTMVMVVVTVFVKVVEQ